MPDVKGKSYAFYADGTFDVTDRLRFLGGIRYTDERSRATGIGGNWGADAGRREFRLLLCDADRDRGLPAQFARPPQLRCHRHNDAARHGAISARGGQDALAFATRCLPHHWVDCQWNQPQRNLHRSARYRQWFRQLPRANGSFTYANLTIPGQQVGSSKFNFVDWRAGIEFDVSDDNMVYAKVSTGHKSGGFNDSFNGSRIPETFSPEKLIVCEVGSRNSFDVFGRPAVFNVTGFYYDYSNQVFQDLTCIGRAPPIPQRQMCPAIATATRWSTEISAHRASMAPKPKCTSSCRAISGSI